MIVNKDELSGGYHTTVEKGARRRAR